MRYFVTGFEKRAAKVTSMNWLRRSTAGATENAAKKALTPTPHPTVAPAATPTAAPAAPTPPAPTPPAATPPKENVIDYGAMKKQQAAARAANEAAAPTWDKEKIKESFKAHDQKMSIQNRKDPNSMQRMTEFKRQHRLLPT